MKSSFTGEVIAKGNLILFYPKTTIKNLKVVFKGVFKNNKLKLHERYIENQKEIIRSWVLRSNQILCLLEKKKMLEAI